MSSFLFEKEIRIFGMKRSGNTTTAEFLLRHFKPYEAIILNNTNLSFNPSHSLKRRRIGGFDKRIVKAKGRARYFVNGIEHLPIPVIKESLKCGYCYDSERTKSAIKYEKDFFSKEIYNIILLRSPHNHFASILKKREIRRAIVEEGSYYLGFLDLWLQYAEEVLGITDYIPNKVVVLFDKLVSSRSYKESVSAALGISYTEDCMNFIDKNRGNTFFETYRHDLKWWAAYHYKEMSSHPKVVEYTKELFNIDLVECFNE